MNIQEVFRSGDGSEGMFPILYGIVRSTTERQSGTWMRHIAESGLLNNTWRDMLALIGVVGFVLTAIGVWLAWAQMRRTATAAKAATDAAIAAFDESRARYNQQTTGHIVALLDEMKVNIRMENWSLAIVRVGDITKLILGLTHGNRLWVDFAKRLQTTETSFGRIARKRIMFSDHLSGKWNKLDHEIRTQIALQYGLFQNLMGGEQ